MTDGCPDAALLAAWSEGRASRRDRVEIERHLAGCPACADVAAVALRGATTRDASIPTAADAGAPPPRRRAGRARLALAASLVVATAALAYAAVDALATRGRDALVTRASAALGQPVSIGRLGIGMSRDLSALELRLREVRVGTGEPLVADDVTVRVPLASLAAGAPVVSRLRVAGAVIHFDGGSPTLAGSGRLGGANIVAAAMGSTALEIADGTLIANVDAGPPLRVEHVAGTTTLADDHVDIALTGAFGGGKVTAEGAVALDATGASSMTIGGRNVATAALPGGARVGGTSELLLRVSGPAHAPILAGRLLVRAGRFHGWNPLAQMLGALKNAPPLRAAAPQLTADDLAFDELRVAFASDAQGWRIPRLFVTSGGIAGGASVTVDGSQRLAGSGSVSLPKQIVDAVVGALPAFAARRADDGTMTFPLAIAGTVAAPAVTLAQSTAAPPSASAAASAPPSDAPTAP